MTIVDLLCSRRILEPYSELPAAVVEALPLYNKFCELGAVSPDYPYLVLTDENAKGWANLMHYWRTADFIKRGIHHLLDTYSTLNTSGAQQCIAWLFGYASHLVVDLTIHPVIELLVGPYAKRPDEHRLCEMHQDAYIFYKHIEDEIETAEYIAHGGINDCGEKLGDTHHLAVPIVTLWTSILNEVILDEVTFPSGIPKPSMPPEPDRWHHHYVTKIDHYATRAGRFFFARGALESHGAVYPPSKKVDPRYTRNLKTPSRSNEDYDSVFERARQNVLSVWREMGAAIRAENSELISLANANLDTGIADEAQPGSMPIYWTA